MFERFNNYLSFSRRRHVMAVPSRVLSRLVSGLKKFQPILENAKTRDVNESDTVTILADILQDVFGYDKYTDITSEHAIRGTYVDLAIKHDGKLILLIEVKAVNTDLKEAFVKQAVDYATNQGVDWVILTNGINWKVFKILFTKPIEHELLYEFNFQLLNPKDEEHLDMLFMIAKESWTKSLLGDFHAQKQVVNKFTLTAIALSDPILEAIRRELRKLSPGIKVGIEEIQKVLQTEGIKRDCLEGEKADLAKKILNKAANKAANKAKAEKEEAVENTSPPEDQPPQE